MSNKNKKNINEMAILDNTESKAEDSFTLADGRTFEINKDVKKRERRSDERKGYVRVFKNINTVNIEDALEKGFRPVIDKETNKAVERSGGQRESLESDKLLKQLYMEIPIGKWKALKEQEQEVRMGKNKSHIKDHILNNLSTETDDGYFSSPNLGAGIDIQQLKEESFNSQ